MSFFYKFVAASSVFASLALGTVISVQADGAAQAPTVTTRPVTEQKESVELVKVDTFEKCVDVGGVVKKEGDRRYCVIEDVKFWEKTKEVVKDDKKEVQLVSVRKREGRLSITRNREAVEERLYACIWEGSRLLTEKVMNLPATLDVQLADGVDSVDLTVRVVRAQVGDSCANLEKVYDKTVTVYRDEITEVGIHASYKESYEYRRQATPSGKGYLVRTGGAI